MRKSSGEYRKKLKESELDTASMSKRNVKRFFSALRALEVAGERDSCIVCGARTYRDACVLIRPGCWAAPAAFHEKDCKLAKAMSEAHVEIIKDETAREKIWDQIERPRIVRESLERTYGVLNALKGK